LIRAANQKGDFFVKRFIMAGLTVLTLGAPAAAQGYEPNALPPHEILTILRSTGFDPLGQPLRRGPNYVLRAIDENDREVSVVVSARSGEVRSVTPVQTASRMPPGVSMGDYERMPPGYIAPDAYRPGPRGPYGPPVVEEDDAPPPRVYGSRPPVPGQGMQPRLNNTAPPSRDGAMQPDDDDDASPNAPNVTADPNWTGMLPPPPERFPQRAAPAPPKPKPVQRAAAAPKPAPLPKPKPGGAVEASPQPTQSQPPAAWPESKPAEAPLPN
jgi:hypothetical protein